ncbi:MAG: hypothetical protein K1X94_29220 [Sandaracinaceae bacterium]|nr:hypothetical protein [Sandaracinaceae bacterium]
MNARVSNRRSVLRVLSALPALGLISSRVARADMAWDPPPELRVQPDAPTYTTPPRTLGLTVSNVSAEPAEVSGPRLVVLLGTVRVPVRLTGLEIDGQPRGLWDEFVISARGSVHLTLAFEELPPAALAARRIDFALRFQGAGESTFSLRRA